MAKAPPFNGLIRREVMNWMWLHLITVLMAAVLGAWVLLRPKGGLWHRRFGRVYVVLMMLASASSLMLPAQVGPQLWLHFGFIHLLSIFVLLAMPTAIWAARQGLYRVHRGLMLGNYIGGIGVAGILAALLPGRFLHGLLF